MQPGEGQGRPLTSSLTQRATGQHLTPPTPARAGQAWHQDPAEQGQPVMEESKGPAFPLSTCPGNKSLALRTGGATRPISAPSPSWPPTLPASGTAPALPAEASRSHAGTWTWACRCVPGLGSRPRLRTQALGTGNLSPGLRKSGTCTGASSSPGRCVSRRAGPAREAGRSCFADEVPRVTWQERQVVESGRGGPSCCARLARM